MIINLSEIGENGLSFNLKKKPEWFNDYNVDLKDRLIRINSDIEFSIDLFKVVKEISVKGSVEFEIVSSCSLCLDEVDQLIKLDINFLLSPSENFDEEEYDIDHETYSGEQLDLNDYFRQQISLSLPFKVVCGESCEGLCAKCGKNLNYEKCECNTKWEDPRFSILKGIKV